VVQLQQKTEEKLFFVGEDGGGKRREADRGPCEEAERKSQRRQ
jgi:hypothetical protein